MADKELQRPYKEAGCKILLTEKKMNHIDLDYLMEQLGNEKIDSILLEGGGTLNWAALEAGIVQKVQAYIAPKLLEEQQPRLRWKEEAWKNRIRHF